MTRPGKFICLAVFPTVVFALLTSLCAQESASSSSENRVVKPADPMSAPNNGAIDASDLQIGPGDLLEIKVYGVPEMSDTGRVSSAGEVTIPLAGAIRVSGETVEEAQKQIEKRLLHDGLLRDPHVTILVKEFASQGISVLGEVAHPGVYPLLGPRTLFDALAAAGGTTNRAGRTIAIRHRNGPVAAETTAVLLSKDPQEASKQNTELQPGDTIIVSKAGIVYVSGDVKMPGGYLLDNNESLTVLQAIALAQGLNATASGKNVRIIRRASGKLEEIPVELKQIMEAKSPDVALQNGDVLFIPNSASKSAARKSLDSIVEVATGLAIYRR